MADTKPARSKLANPVLALDIKISTNRLRFGVRRPGFQSGHLVFSGLVNRAGISERAIYTV